jgi:hypothetical protein
VDRSGCCPRSRPMVWNRRYVCPRVPHAIGARLPRGRRGLCCRQRNPECPDFRKRPPLKHYFM